MTLERFVSQLELAAQSQAVRWARRHTRDVLSAWSVPGDHIDATALAVSELVTNAVKHAAPPDDEPSPPPATLTLRHRDTHLIVEVADPDTRPPISEGNSDPTELGGRGLFIVDTISKEWGYYLPPTGGKVVWCVMALD
ncbi:ATP-binding protein [Streptomyces turgidiscabies]|uniref:ATPase/histidine kinase/DNA gyrase B/HSP90 domain protein n=1 Tax=Streptomyces turgidiscabies (strain Car8) TaxID=698760 RepID=L7F577_STRT8|nr:MULTISPECIES: ATP-binding protein [Streptomyces]ELP66141.1 ATPase/histidine kinase/DNA gyrase B/HSP90 domain protein [Streptomyces turgidiscabies Car8]MDX3494551.1 ATP-binding protein [Streptomyces turgidiscabies]GAQ76415.1 histidine kinase-, DNA gyrase B-, and HSP90-like ATPase [Streptomyces turgidiscabies]